MDTTSNFASCIQARHRLATLVEHTRLGVNLQTTHGVVEDGGHNGDVEEVIKLPFTLEEFLAEGVLLGAYALVVVVKGLLEDFRCDTELLGKSITAVEALHEATSDVVLAMPCDLRGRRSVENETDGELAVLPHLASDKVTVL